MTPELQKQLAEMLVKLTDATQWVAGQLPPLVAEKIAFGRVSESVQLALCCISAYLIWLGCVYCHSQLPESDGGWNVGFVFSIVGLVVFAFLIAEQIQNVMMVFFAPRLYIVEWLHGMVKS